MIATIILSAIALGAVATHQLMKKDFRYWHVQARENLVFGAMLYLTGFIIYLFN